MMQLAPAHERFGDGLAVTVGGGESQSAVQVLDQTADVRWLPSGMNEQD